MPLLLVLDPVMYGIKSARYVRLGASYQICSMEGAARCACTSFSSFFIFRRSKRSVRRNIAEVRSEQTDEPRDHGSWKNIEIAVKAS